MTKLSIALLFSVASVFAQGKRSHQLQMAFSYLDTIRLNGEFCVKRGFRIDVDSGYIDYRYSSIKYYHPSGQLKSEEPGDAFDASFNSEEPSPPFVEYSKSGYITRFYHIKNQRIVGLYAEFYDDGKRKEAGYYVYPDGSESSEGDCVTVYESPVGAHNNVNDRKNGRWYYWDTKGQLVQCEFWANGILFKSIDVGTISKKYIE